MATILLGIWFLASSIWVTFSYLFSTFYPHLTLHECFFASIPVGQAFGTCLSFFISGLIFAKPSLWSVLICCVLFTLLGVRYHRLCSPKFSLLRQRGGVDSLLPSTQDPLFKIIFVSFLYFSYIFLANTFLESGSEFIAYGPSEELPAQLAIINSFLHGTNSKFYPWRVKSTLFSHAELGVACLPGFLSALLIKCGFGVQDAIVVPGVLSGISLPALLYLFSLRFTCNRPASWLAVLLTLLSGGVGHMAWIFEDGFHNAWNYTKMAGSMDLPWLNLTFDILLPTRGTIVGYGLFLTAALILWVTFANVNVPIPCTKLPAYLIPESGVFSFSSPSSSSLPSSSSGSSHSLSSSSSSLEAPSSPSPVSVTLSRPTRKIFFVTAGAIIALTPLFHPQAMAAGFVLGCGLAASEVVRFVHEPFYLYHWISYFVTLCVFGYLQVVLVLPRPSTYQSWGTFNLHRIWRDSMSQNLILFWMEGLGIFVFLAFLFAKHLDNIQRKFYVAGVGTTFLVGNLVRMQPFPENNVRYFYCCQMLSSVVVTQGLLKFYQRARKSGHLGRILLVLFIAVSLTASGVLVTLRELNQKSVMYDKQDLVAAEWIKQNTNWNDVFLTSDRMIQITSMLAGRPIVLAHPKLVWRNGFDFSKRWNDVMEIFKCQESMKKSMKNFRVKWLVVDKHMKEVHQLSPECMKTIGTTSVFKSTKLEIFKVNQDLYR